MAGGNITIEQKLRPCFVILKGCRKQNGERVKKKALFHRWVDKTNVLPNGEVERWTMALAEAENGRVFEYEPSQIQFMPGKVNEYCYGPEKEE